MKVPAVSVKDLKQKYSVLPVDGLGDCVIVPGEEFDPDWEVYLGDQGYNCVNDTLDGHPVTFIQLKKEEATRRSKKPTKASHREKGKVCGGSERWWTLDEEVFLISLWNRTPHLKTAIIVKEFQAKFPKRSSCGILNRLWLLQQADRIERRFSVKHKIAKAADLGRSGFHEEAIAV